MSEVLVVHCVDAEGPLGGDARRNADGSAEFFDNWPDILASLTEFDDRRWEMEDSFGRPYRVEWFPLDFTGFKTNPKQRDTAPHAVYDMLHTLPGINLDGIGFHHHIPPVSGVGDEWADRWDPTEADAQLARRRAERDQIPFSFRAGGTIEFDGPMQDWLDEHFLLDFSNRVSERSYPCAPLTDFNWYGAPTYWGSHQPTGGRHVYRCIDLRSRYNELTDEHCDEAFEQAKFAQRPAVLSFFSHDNRDMRPETTDAVAMIRRASVRHGLPWRSCTALDAHERHHA